MLLRQLCIISNAQQIVQKQTDTEKDRDYESDSQKNIDQSR
jgi:hypothetical protein